MTTSASMPAAPRRGRPPKAAAAPLLGDPGEHVAKKPGPGPQAPPAEDAIGFPAPTELSEDLFKNNMRLALMVARRWAARTKMPFEIFKTYAYIGLLRATRKYNPNLLNPRTGEPYRLSTYAIPVIDTEIKHMLRRGHTSGVKFPDKWRDHAPKIRKLAGEGQTHEQISEIMGFSADEIREILEAQSCTKQINLDEMGYAHFDQDLSDDVIDCEEYINALRIADEAWMGLDWSEQQLLVRGWQGNGRPGRQDLAQRPFDRFKKYVTTISAGHPLPRGVRQPLLDLQIVADSGEAIQINKSTEIIAALEQMALDL